MGTPYLSEIRIVSFGFAPKGWALCNGQLLPINQDQALFSLMGTTYGGNGQTNFALPNLQGAMALHMGNGFVIGQAGGSSSVTLVTSQLPAHSHPPAAGVSNAANLVSPVNNTWAKSIDQPYRGTPGAGMNVNNVGQTGGNQPHNNMAPYLVLNFVIALQGIFPSRN